MFGEAAGEKKRTDLSLRENVYSDNLNQVPKQVFDFKMSKLPYPLQKAWYFDRIYRIYRISMLSRILSIL